MKKITPFTLFLILFVQSVTSLAQTRTPYLKTSSKALTSKEEALKEREAFFDIVKQVMNNEVTQHQFLYMDNEVRVIPVNENMQISWRTYKAEYTKIGFATRLLFKARTKGGIKIGKNKYTNGGNYCFELIDTYGRPFIFEHELLNFELPSINKKSNTDAYAANTSQAINHKYTLATSYGHIIEIEMDYAIGSDGYINNGCEAQYIVTNTGNKNLNSDEKFKGGSEASLVSEHIVWDSLYSIIGIAFEFTMSDGKTITTSNSLWNGATQVLTGQSFPANTVEINAGDRQCVSVKPVRIEMRFAGKRARKINNSSNKK